jgi:hypothetical protein
MKNRQRQQSKSPTRAWVPADLSAGAAADAPTEWHDIEWRSVHKVVRRLQARIVKATKEGKMGRVKALQHLLTCSFSGKALAVKRVTENPTVSKPRPVERALHHA